MTKLCECGVCGLPAPLASVTMLSRGWVKGQPIRFIHGHRANKGYGLKEGQPPTPEYQAYTSAKLRCTNPDAQEWLRYGARGIKFLFISYFEFLMELGPRPAGMSLDRWPNNDGNYEPGNVRWATAKEQASNRRNCWITRRSKQAVSVG